MAVLDRSVALVRPVVRTALAGLYERALGRLAPWVYGVALAFWASSWHLRLSVLMAWMPAEPVTVASVLLVLCVVHRCGREVRIEPATLWPLVLVVVGFLPGALLADGEGYGPEKVARMVFIMLPVVVATILLLDSRAARRGWLGAQVLVGVAVVIAAVTTSHTSLTQPGRYTLTTVDTVSTGRLVGGAAVVMVLTAMTSWRRALWAVPLAAGCGAVLVQVGSRGPLLFVLVSVLVVALVGRCFAGHRLILAVALSLMGAAAYRYAVAEGGTGGERLLAEGFSDVGRAHLLGDAVRAGLAHPFGVGWGDFATQGPAARAIANAQGVSYAHDAFAEAFSEGGWLALAAFVVLVVVAVSRLWRSTGRAADAVLWGSGLYWVLNALVSLDFVGNRFMWIALASALVVPGAEVGDPPGRRAPG